MNGGKFKDELTYGENAHQKAEFFQDEETRKTWGNFKKLHGKKLSYNNHLDLDASLNLLYNFKNFQRGYCWHNKTYQSMRSGKWKKPSGSIQ